MIEPPSESPLARVMADAVVLEGAAVKRERAGADRTVGDARRRRDRAGLHLEGAGTAAERDSAPGSCWRHRGPALPAPLLVKAAAVTPLAGTIGAAKCERIGRHHNERAGAGVGECHRPRIGEAAAAVEGEKRHAVIGGAAARTGQGDPVADGQRRSAGIIEMVARPAAEAQRPGAQRIGVANFEGPTPC